MEKKTWQQKIKKSLTTCLTNSLNRWQFSNTILKSLLQLIFTTLTTFMILLLHVCTSQKKLSPFISCPGLCLLCPGLGLCLCLASNTSDITVSRGWFLTRNEISKFSSTIFTGTLNRNIRAQQSSSRRMHKMAGQEISSANLLL